ncbi:hypothetical protein TCAL_06643 [Tigriopus californicus]|uniref:Neurotransmitter-gated ion-channel ligand-binding domain-containing protein n=1 Tax=Tigriopus californicus TaxID=6832 RepID=A0A553NY03_TIGCA|nr:glycine receptor subunit alpha-2-like [Tigriopus californicus]TRY70306.1 hypothetical protein TCAL_06643 [Tigriopus californicus]
MPLPRAFSLETVFFILILLNLQIRPARSYEDKPLGFEDIVDQSTYDKMRPPKPEGGATHVSFHVTVMSLDTIDEGSMTYAADVFFAQEWKDHRLILPDNMTRDYRLLPVEWLHMIWRPDSYFKNAKKVTFQTMTVPNHYVWLYKDKTILYMVKLTLLLSCAMHFENYPHDEQICRLSMESLSHTTDDLIFVWLPEDKTPLAVDQGIELPQLELVSNFTGDCTSVYSTGNFTCLEVIFKFRRRLGYYLFHTYIPTCLIVMMSWISFWIKPEAVPARVTLGVTSLLTLSTQHANSQKSLPPVSYIKAIDIFMSSCTVFVFLSLIEYAFVNVMMGDISEVERKDKTAHLRSIIISDAINSRNHGELLSQIKSMENESNFKCPKHQEESQQSKPKKDPKEIMKKRREQAICIDRVSRVIFPSTFILLNIIYWLVFSEILKAIKYPFN